MIRMVVIGGVVMIASKFAAVLTAMVALTNMLIMADQVVYRMRMYLLMMRRHRSLF